MGQSKGPSYFDPLSKIDLTSWPIALNWPKILTTKIITIIGKICVIFITIINVSQLLKKSLLGSTKLCWVYRNSAGLTETLLGFKDFNC